MSEKNWDQINEYYRQNPPDYILDDDTVRHQKEIAMPAEYEYAPCECGKIHKPEDDTWWHSPMELTVAGRIGIYRCCKTCMNVLGKKRKGL